MPALGSTGYSLLEILVAMAIFSIASVGLTTNIAFSTRTAHLSEQLTHATIFAQDQLEVLSARPALRVSSSDTPQTGFTRAWTVSPDTPHVGVSQLEVTVSWTDSHQRTVTLITVLND